MGIPQKKKQPFSVLWQGLQVFADGVMSIPRALKDVPNMPKGKLLKLTGFFFIGSLTMYYINGPYKKIRIMRHYKNGEEIYKIYGEKQGVSSSLPGNERPFQESYGLDFQAVIDARNASETTNENKD